MYYDYPYNENNQKLYPNDIHLFISHKSNFFPPDNHFNETGDNILQALRKDNNSSVYITLDDFYYLNTGWEVYGRLNQEEFEKYYNLSYINKIYSSKSELGKEYPLYFVI